MSKTKRQNLFVIFPPGLGGNHLANILSLDPTYTTRFNIDAYDHLANNAHVAEMTNIDCDYIKDNIDRLSNQNNVFAGHLIEYSRLKLSNLLRYFPYRSFCLIQFPPPDTPAYKRLVKQNGVIPNWLYSEAGFMYTNTIFKNIFQEISLQSRFWHVYPEKLFAEDIRPLLQELHSFSIDQELAQQLHTKWINSI